MDNELFLLSGMIYKQGYYTPQEWERKTGINPLRFGEYIKVNKSGLCIWTDKAERLYKSYQAQATRNWNALGIGK